MLLPSSLEWSIRYGEKKVSPLAGKVRDKTQKRLGPTVKQDDNCQRRNSLAKEKATSPTRYLLQFVHTAVALKGLCNGHRTRIADAVVTKPGGGR